MKLYSQFKQPVVLNQGLQLINFFSHVHFANNYAIGCGLRSTRYVYNVVLCTRLAAFADIKL